MPRSKTKPMNGPIGYDHPEYQARKAARRSISHHEAVLESMFLQKQFRELWSHKLAPSPVDLKEIIRTLNQKKIPFVLTGAHAIGGWTGRPRDTHDVDILIKSGRNHARAVKAMKELYPGLETKVLFGVTAFFLPGETQSVLNVTYPHRADNAATLEQAIWLEKDGLRYRILTLENALANKYGAMLAVSRDPLKRALDAVDFGWMVRHSSDPGQTPIDLERLRTLGELVWPGGGGEEILRLVEEVKTGRIVDLNALSHRPGG
jgi:hypothetical protein